MRQRLGVCSLICLLAVFCMTGTVFAEIEKDEYFVDESKLPFEAIEGNESERLWGIHNGAGYRIEVPQNWKGDLVLYAHGYRNEAVKELTVDNPANLRKFLLENGYAWAASSYSKNGYDVKQGVKDTHALENFFHGKVGRPENTYVVGHSMGGHITGAMIEQYQNSYDGALPMCGVMGDAELFDFFADYNLASQVLAGVEVQFPAPLDYQTAVVPKIKEELGLNTGMLTEEGEMLSNLTENLSGGERPLFDAAFSRWKDFLFTLYRDNSSYGTPGNIIDNTDSVYQLDSDPELSELEREIAQLIPDISADPQGRNKNGLSKIPHISGQFDVPVITLHTLGDLFVPFSMEQIYAQRAAVNGNSDLLVSRAVRAVGHCEFTPEEETKAFADLTDWAEGGEKPNGDDILNPEAVRKNDFGSEFTLPLRSYDPLRQ
ncbi:hypothetical protein [Halobacillus sp. Marseille-Q1614]|uniref:hypothetical protein n=1 Tax=Halobacillus sp. Marseille-Q1614 TaxID=2709134 RepID=UPI0015706B15|nr:hypothetical protein [Halobacillus sp. Marseille-Q1614]